jgi:hypothetical protein
MGSNVLDIVYLSILSYRKCNKIENQPSILFSDSLSYNEQTNKRFENVKSIVNLIYNMDKCNLKVVNFGRRIVMELEPLRGSNLFVAHLRSLESEVFNHIIFDMNNSFLKTDPIMRVYILAIWNGFKNNSRLISLTDISLYNIKTIMLETSRLLYTHYRFNNDTNMKIHRLIQDITIVYSGQQQQQQQQIINFIKINSLFLISIIFNWKNIT